MVDNNRVVGMIFTLLGTILFLLTFAVPGNSQTLYTCESPRGEPVLHTIDPDTGATLSTTPITLAGEELRGCNGLARDPGTGVCWIILTGPGSGGIGSDPGPRILATIDTDTGIATGIGNTGLAIASITFDTLGTLYGITGNQDGAAIPTIYILSKIDGAPTFFQDLVGTEGGEAIGFNPIDGLIYRTTGFTDLNGGQNFGSVDPQSKEFTQILLTGDTDGYGEQLALVHLSGDLFLSAQRIEPALNSITTGGVVSFIGNMDHEAKGLAFECGVAPPSPAPASIPTLSEWGLIITAGALGIIGLMVIRRRKLRA